MHFTLWTEKIENKGEDAKPTLFLEDNISGLLAVYDGMGGAGSKTFTVLNQDREETHSGAYLASRLAKSILENYYLQEEESFENFVELLKDQLKTGFDAFYEQLEQQRSLLRSKLIKHLPTTLAGIYFENNPDEDLETKAFWAGDSRCYILQKEGLLQLSTDDLHGDPDALENLIEDATISNCIQAKGDFELHQRTFYVDGPCLLITASDGCFAYLPSPAHFEYILLDTLMNSYYDLEDWKDKLTEKLELYTADDMSLSLIGIGFDNLNQLKTVFHHRYVEIFQQYIQPLEEIDHKIERSLHSQHLEEVADFKEKRQVLLLDLWDKYKVNYYPID